MSKFNFRNIDPRKAFIKSALVQADLESLNQQMKEDKDTRELLLCPADKLEKDYQYLLAENFEGWETGTLYYLIERTFNDVPSDQIYFSTVSNKIVGWCAYTINHSPVYKHDVVNNIKMFSFNLKKYNVVLLRDLRKLIELLLKKYPSISWVTVKENENANRIYNAVIEEYNGTVIPFNNLYHYEIKRQF